MTEWMTDAHRWRIIDEMATEGEVSDLVAALAHATKPEWVLETGAYQGHTTVLLAWAAYDYGGHVCSIEMDPELAEITRSRCRHPTIGDLPVEVLVGNSLEVPWPDKIGLAFLDSGDPDVRIAELDRLLDGDHLTPNAIVVIHDTGPNIFGDLILEPLFDREFSAVTLRSPRGVTIAQRIE